MKLTPEEVKDIFLTDDGYISVIRKSARPTKKQIFVDLAIEHPEGFTYYDACEKGFADIASFNAIKSRFNRVELPDALERNEIPYLIELITVREQDKDTRYVFIGVRDRSNNKNEINSLEIPNTDTSSETEETPQPKQTTPTFFDQFQLFKNETDPVIRKIHEIHWYWQTKSKSTSTNSEWIVDSAKDMINEAQIDYSLNHLISFESQIQNKNTQCKYLLYALTTLRFKGMYGNTDALDMAGTEINEIITKGAAYVEELEAQESGVQSLFGEVISDIREHPSHRGTKETLQWIDQILSKSVSDGIYPRFLNGIFESFFETKDFKSACYLVYRAIALNCYLFDFRTLEHFAHFLEGFGKFVPSAFLYPPIFIVTMFQKEIIDHTGHTKDRKIAKSYCNRYLKLAFTCLQKANRLNQFPQILESFRDLYIFSGVDGLIPSNSDKIKENFCCKICHAELHRCESMLVAKDDHQKNLFHCNKCNSERFYYGGICGNIYCPTCDGSKHKA